MQMLVLDSGRSPVRYRLVDMESGDALACGVAELVHEDDMRPGSGFTPIAGKASATGRSGRFVQLLLHDDEGGRMHGASARMSGQGERVPSQDAQRLPIDVGGRTRLVPYGDIVFAEASQDYSYVHTETQQYLTTYRLKHLESRLAAHHFFRVHRKYLVNLRHILELRRQGRSYALHIGDEREPIPVARGRVGRLKTVLGL